MHSFRTTAYFPRDWSLVFNLLSLWYKLRVWLCDNTDVMLAKPTESITLVCLVADVSALQLVLRLKADLTNWDRVTQICGSKLTMIGLNNGLLPGRHQAIIWIHVRILLIWSLGTNHSELLIEIYITSSKKMYLKCPSAKLRPCCRGLNV